MKRFALFFSALIILTGMLAISGVSNNVFGQSGTLNGHEYVDLGLPSGLLWATCNVGAKTPEAYGDYYAWGEVKSKKKYMEKNYKYTDTPIELMSKVDVANVNWKGSWRMPTRENFEELIETCTWVWRSNGYEIKGPNGNVIFLPAAGGQTESGLYDGGTFGAYWSSSLCKGKTSCAICLNFRSHYNKMCHDYRYFGMCVRPVIASTKKTSSLYSEPTGYTNGYGYVDLGLPSGTKWATCNLGATTPTDYGYYLAWGESKPKDEYTKHNYKYSSGIDNLSAANDAINANWGAGWRMPSYDELMELMTSCTNVWSTQNGVAGRLLTGPNGNSIFLPAAGSREDNEFKIVGDGGTYWSGLIDTDINGAWSLSFFKAGFFILSKGGSNGLSVRPVLAE